MAKGNFSQGVSNAVDDIRARYEEAVYGRSLTGNASEVAGPEEQELQPGFGGHLHIIDRDVKEWQQAEPKAAVGEVLPPEQSFSQEAGKWARIGHGTVLEGHAEQVRDDAPQIEWPQAVDAREPKTPEPDRDRGIDL